MRSSKHKDREFYSDESNKSSKRSKLDKVSYRPSKTLCISQFAPRMSEDEIQSTLHKELRKYGEYNITLSRSSKNGKIAYVQFRYPEDAQAVRSAHKNKSLNLDPMISIENADELAGSKSSSPFVTTRTSDHYVPSPESSGPSKARSDKFYQDDAEDKAATRTLFIGNLDLEITEAELNEIFGRYGHIEDIDIKRGSQTHGSVYAFIRFFNLEMARRAKKEMSGQYIRKYQCRIGYGKHVPSNCLWVGSLGPWVTKDDLERCFGSFNPLRIEWSYGRSHAYLVFSSLEVATSVLNSMQGFELCPGRFIRLDYSDENHIAALMNPAREDPAKVANKVGGDSSSETKSLRQVPAILNVVPSPLKPFLSEVQNVPTLVKHSQIVWKGILTLKNVNVPVKMHLISGLMKIIDTLLTKESVNTENLQVKLSHEISLNHKKIKDLFDGIQSNTFDCAILIVEPDTLVEGSETMKHFQMTVAHLRRKHVAALSLLPTGTNLEKCSGVLHLLPSFNSVKQLIQVLCPKILDIPLRECLFAIVNTVTVC